MRADDYLVVRGDTLYGIAFRHRLDTSELARWNRIAAPYTIYPGQRLRLRASAGNAPVIRRRAASVTSYTAR
jgi:lipoprotein NlpD